MQIDEVQPDTLLTGMVVRKNRGQYLVRQDGRSIPCAISNRLRKTLIYPTAAPTSLHHRVQRVDEIEVIDPIAVGDRVSFLDAGDGAGVIHEVLPRKSQLSRRAPVSVPREHPIEQVMVANVDQAVIVFSAAKPAPVWNLLDRYLVTAESSNLPAVIVITKLDLAAEEELRELDIYRSLDYPILLSSAVDGRGIVAVRACLRGKISVLMGKSGVGKSSLLNAVQPGLGLKVNEVSKGELGKGLHTTSHLEMFALEEGGAVVDTPGMRYLSLWNIPEGGLAALFPEMRPYLGRCQFQSNCQHEHEPGCAIRKAVTAGKIHPRRYESYLKFMGE